MANFNELTGTANPFNGVGMGEFNAPTFADIDGDGDKDAIVGARFGTLFYYKNTGSATNPVYTEQIGSNNPFNGINVGFSSAPTLADIDGDGDLDAIVGEREGTLLYYKNIGSATDPVYTQQIGSNNPFNGIDVENFSQSTLADIDGDGDLDAFVGEGEGTLLYYKNTGSATSPVYTQQIGSNNPFNGIDVGYKSAPTFADIDGDGDLDAFVGEDYGTIWYFQNTGSATNPVYTQQIGSNNLFNDIDVGSRSTPTFADIDGDGDLDALVGAAGGTLKYFQNNTPPEPFAFVAAIGTANPFNGITLSPVSAPTLADIDGDGDLDAFVGEGYGTIWYFQNTGSATNPVYTQQIGSNNPFNGIDVRSVSAPTLADIDGDGDLDAIVGERNGTLLYYKNTGSATNPVYTQQIGGNNPFNDIDVREFSRPTFADIDGDGDKDSIVGENDGTLLYYKNTGSATNPVYTQQIGGNNPFNGIDVGDISAPTLADIDGDGDLDALVGEWNGTLLYYKNTGTATNPFYTQQFGNANPFNGIDVGYFSSPTLADIDGDGDLDALVGEWNGTLLYYKNNRLPVAVNDAVSTNENTVFSGNLLAANPTTPDSDPDGNPLTVTAVNGSAANVGTQINLGNGKLTVNANGTFNFDPTNGTATLSDGYDYLAQGATATESFSYTISDGNGGTANATATITITGVNDAATIDGTSTGAVTEDASTPNLTTAGTLTIDDPDSNQDRFSTSVTTPAGVTNLESLSITDTGNWNYSVANSKVQSLGAGVTKKETFTVQSVDGTIKDIVVTITGVNDAPTLAKEIADRPATANQSFNFVIPADTFADVDAGDILTYTATLENNAPLPSWLTFDPNTRALSGTPTINDAGILNIKITASDTQGATVTDILVLTVAGANVINGDDNNNSLSGTPSADVINGFGGDDYIEGLAGNDTIDGGTGRFDRIFAGDGDDEIIDPDGILGAHGGTGNDTINLTFAANWDNDTNPSTAPRSDGKITGGYGNDTITVTMNNSQFFINLKGDEPLSNTPQDGNDLVTLLGRYQNAIVDLGGGNDNFIGGNGSDNVTGGAGNDTIFGFGGNDKLTGNDGDDVLVGGAGNDNLTGGNGKDIFGFSSPISDGIDTITDFSAADDKIRVEAGGFSGGLVAGNLPQTQFVLGSVAQNQSSRFIYNQATGALFFDVDGTGSSGQVQIATLSTKPVIDATNILVV